MALASAGALLLEITATTLLQRIVPDSVRGRTIGTMETASVIAYAVGAFLVPVLAAVQPGPCSSAWASIMAVSGVIGVVLLGRFAVQVPTSRPDAFASWPTCRCSPACRRRESRPRCAQRRSARCQPGELIIRQGDPADNFYVIVGRPRGGHAGTPRTARRGCCARWPQGEFFGEIGLLSRVPRTATVTAVTDGTLISLPAKHSWSWSEGPGLTYRLLDLHRGAQASEAS